MKRVSGARLAELALAGGWFFISQRGSHAKYRDPATGRMVIIPLHGCRDLCPSTQKNIMRVLGVTDKDL